METPESELKKGKRSVLRGYSIQRRIPLLIFILLLCVMTAFSLISYFAVKRAALNSGKERLLTLSNQLSDMLSQSLELSAAASRAAARQTAIKETILSGGASFSDEAGGVIRKLRKDSTSLLIELLTSDGKSVIQWGLDSIQYKVNFRSLLSVKELKPDSLVAGNIYRVRDSMYYPLTVPVLDNQKHIGYLVVWNLLTTTPQAVAQLSQLLGANATLYIGNADGSLWTNMLRPVPLSLPQDMRSRTVSSYQSMDGEQVLGAFKPIENSPWLVLIQFSSKRVMETANSFLLSMVLLGIGIIVIAMLIAWYMSRRLIRPLNKLANAATAIADGDYTVRVDVNRADEVGNLARTFNKMVHEVNAARSELEEKITEASEMNTQLRELSAHLQNIREEERIHIAREMHDELGQILTGFKMDASWLQKRWDSGTNPALIAERISAMSGAIDEAVKFVRKLACELRPSLLDDLGLIPALDWHGKEFEKRYHIKVDFHSPVSDLDVPPQLATGLFRMYQESLTNVARHAQATVVVSTLTLKDEQLCLSIMDNGKGFDANLSGKRMTLGLLGMKERATMIGGNLEITSTPGRGTHVYIIIPRFQEIPVRV